MGNIQPCLGLCCNNEASINQQHPKIESSIFQSNQNLHSDVNNHFVLERIVTSSPSCLLSSIKQNQSNFFLSEFCFDIVDIDKNNYPSKSIKSSPPPQRLRMTNSQILGATKISDSQRINDQEEDIIEIKTNSHVGYKLNAEQEDQLIRHIAPTKSANFVSANFEVVSPPLLPASITLTRSNISRMKVAVDDLVNKNLNLVSENQLNKTIEMVQNDQLSMNQNVFAKLNDLNQSKSRIGAWAPVAASHLVIETINCELLNLIRQKLVFQNVHFHSKVNNNNNDSINGSKLRTKLPFLSLSKYINPTPMVSACQLSLKFTEFHLKRTSMYSQKKFNRSRLVPFETTPKDHLLGYVNNSMLLQNIKTNKKEEEEEVHMSHLGAYILSTLKQLLKQYSNLQERSNYCQYKRKRRYHHVLPSQSHTRHCHNVASLPFHQLPPSTIGLKDEVNMDRRFYVSKSSSVPSSIYHDHARTIQIVPTLEPPLLSKFCNRNVFVRTSGVGYGGCGLNGEDAMIGQFYNESHEIEKSLFSLAQGQVVKSNLSFSKQTSNNKGIKRNDPSFHVMETSLLELAAFSDDLLIGLIDELILDLENESLFHQMKTEMHLKDFKTYVLNVILKSNSISRRMGLFSSGNDNRNAEPQDDDDDDDDIGDLERGDPSLNILSPRLNSTSSPSLSSKMNKPQAPSFSPFSPPHCILSPTNSNYSISPVNSDFNSDYGTPIFKRDRVPHRSNMNAIKSNPDQEEFDVISSPIVASSPNTDSQGRFPTLSINTTFGPPFQSNHSPQATVITSPSSSTPINQLIGVVSQNRQLIFSPQTPHTPNDTSFSSNSASLSSSSSPSSSSSSLVVSPILSPSSPLEQPSLDMNTSFNHFYHLPKFSSETHISSPSASPSPRSTSSNSPRTNTSVSPLSKLLAVTSNMRSPLQHHYSSSPTKWQNDEEECDSGGGGTSSYYDYGSLNNSSYHDDDEDGDDDDTPMSPHLTALLISDRANDYLQAVD